jgi:hypothetical protein
MTSMTRSRSGRPLWLTLPLLLAGCGGGDSGAPPADSGALAFADATSTQDAFWTSLQALCGGAFAGTVLRDTPATPDNAFAGVDLVMHVRECSDSEIRIPFHVGEDRSRTWVLTQLPEGIRLKHHHLHEDGSPDDVHFYGGDTADSGTSERQEFPADAFTAELLPAAATNVWTMEVIPGEAFSYGLRRVGTDREFWVEFDLTRPIDPPPAPWGATDFR